MVIRRREIWWTDLGEPERSRPAKRRPVLVVQADPYNDSGVQTVVAAVVTSNTSSALLPGNVFLPTVATGLPRDSVVNVTALVTLDKRDLDAVTGRIPVALMEEVDAGLRRVLAL